MLHVDPKQRYTMDDILQHAFITNRNELPTRELDHNEEASIIKANMSLVFSAMNNPSPINLYPVKGSSLARRRANKRTKSFTES